MAEPVAFRYRAFISYSHNDASSAKWLHRGLESFHIDKDLAGRQTSTGTIPTSLHPIFRDRDDFTAGKVLSEQTLAALDASRALIVLCSPAATNSTYVNEEIRLFKMRHPDRPVIPLIVGGKPGDLELECFPPALKFHVDARGRIGKKPIELLAADAREEGDGKTLALAKVVAGLLGLSSDEVFRRSERERRTAARRRRRVQALVGVLLVGIVAGFIGWIHQAYIKEQINRFITVRPYVLTAETEHSLKAKASFRECAKECPEMIVIPAGSFIMGSPATEFGRSTDEGPQHKVTIDKPFAVSKFDVTFADWDACVSVGGCPRVSDSGFGRATRPVINVTWDDAQQYAAWFSRMTGRTYRLLTEAEWEYAARAGSTTAYYWGDELGKENANCYGCGSHWDNRMTSPVGSFKPNAFGLYDMAGNVWQWVQDCSRDSYNGAPTDGSAWTGADCSRRVVRGGAWFDNLTHLRAARRNGIAAGERFKGLGFRVARTLDQ